VASRSGELNDAPLDELVPLALTGDRSAWEALVDRLKGVVWSAVAAFGLASEDRKDVFAATFFRLNERLATIREPAKLPGWLATTARNEAHTLLRARRRTVATDPAELPPPPAGLPVDDDRLVDAEMRRAVYAAFQTLSPQCRDLLRLLTIDPPLPYKDIADILEMPRGSIGPTRQRCLEQMRRTAALRAFLDRG
jgi:RNA polymerase sigma factor (sigma-70 family)